jgi:hypothetical protein
MALRIEQRVWTGTGGWESIVDAGGLPNAQLVLWFGGGSALKDLRALEMLRERYPHARFIGCSTAGEIAGTRVLDDSITATALQFDHTVVRTAHDAVQRAMRLP